MTVSGVLTCLVFIATVAPLVGMIVFTKEGPFGYYGKVRPEVWHRGAWIGLASVYSMVLVAGLSLLAVGTNQTEKMVLMAGLLPPAMGALILILVRLPAILRIGTEARTKDVKGESHEPDSVAKSAA